MFEWRVIVACGVLLVGAACEKPTGAVPNAQAPQASAASQPAGIPRGTWVEVRHETLRRFTPAVGTFRARQTTRLGPQVNGEIKDVLVDVGDAVVAGQVLVRLDPTFFEIDVATQQAAVEACRGALARAEVDVADREREMQRQLALFEQGAGATKERDDAVAAYQRAVADRDEKRARLAEGEQKLRYSRQKLHDTEIHAPYDGIITLRMANIGGSAASNPVTELLEIQETGVLYLEFALPQELLGRVGVGTPIEFDVEGVSTEPERAKIDVLFPVVDEQTRSFRCRVILANPTLRWRPGLLARVRVVEQEAPDACVVPRAALSQTASGWQVLASNDGHPVPRAVEVGLSAEDKVQITAGLREGDRVLVPAGRR